MKFLISISFSFLILQTASAQVAKSQAVNTQVATKQTVKTLTLDEAFQSALQKNESVRQAGERLLQTEEQLTQAKSTVYPNLSFNASYMVQPQPTDPVAIQFFEE